MSDAPAPDQETPDEPAPDQDLPEEPDDAENPGQGDENRADPETAGDEPPGQAKKDDDFRSP